MSDTVVGSKMAFATFEPVTPEQKTSFILPGKTVARLLSAKTVLLFLGGGGIAAYT